MLEILTNYSTGALSNLTAAVIMAAIAFIFRIRIKKFFLGSTLKAKGSSPSLSLEIDSVKSQDDEWITYFLIENTGSIDVAELRVFLCSSSPINEYLEIKDIRVEDQRKWINDGGQRIQISTSSLHDGCNVTVNQRYFVEFVDSNDQTIYRMCRGAPSAKDGSMASYETAVCRKRLPKRGLHIEGETKVEKAVKKYDIDLTIR